MVGGPPQTVVKVIVGKRANAQKQQVPAGLQHRFGVLVDRFLPGRLHDNIQRLRDKSCPVGGHEHIGVHRTQRGAHQRRH